MTGPASVEATRDDLIRGLVEHFYASNCCLELPSDYPETAAVALDYLNARITPGLQNFIARFDQALSDLAEARAELQRLRQQRGGGDDGSSQAPAAGEPRPAR